MIATSVCKSLEAEKVEIQARKFQLQTPRRDTSSGRLVYPFKVSIYGKARITEAYETDAVLYRECSYRDAEDELRGEALDGFARKPFGRERVEHGTGSHKATFVSMRGGAYAHIEIATRQLLEAKNPGVKKLEVER